MTVPIVAIVGYSDSGKTRVASALVGLLTQRGHRVAAFKHAAHGHTPFPSGKDSDKLRSAGAQEVGVSSPGMVTRTALHPGDLSLDALVAGLSSAPDIVIAEGFKTSNAPKVLIESPEAIAPYPSNVVAVIQAPESGPAAVPSFTMERMEDLATFVEETFMGKQGCGCGEAANAVTLTVDGVAVSLKDYPATALEEIIRGFLRSLKGVPSDAKTVEIRLHRE